MTTAPQTPPSPMTVNAVVIRYSAGLEHKSKVCANCKVPKPRSEYHVRRASQDGLCTICKACNCAKSSAWSKANRKRANARGRKQYWKDVKKSRAYQRKKMAEYWRRDIEANRAKNKVEMRKRYNANPRYFINRSNKWQSANMKKHAAINKRWRKRNPDKWDEIAARATLSRDSTVPPHLWPKPLVETVIVNRKLKRICQNQKT
jgi:hypothetical protein